MIQAVGEAVMTTKSSTALIDATGRDYDDWFTALDAWGAADKSSSDARAWLRDDQGVSAWWAQKLVVEYEQIRGIRVPGARSDGTVTVGASRTVRASQATAFAAVVDPDLRARWLPDVILTQRTATPDRTARFDGPDGTRVNITLDATSVSKTAVSIEQERLPVTIDHAAMRADWKTRLEALHTLLAQEHGDANPAS